VKDPSGASVPGAAVTVVDPSVSITQKTTTNEAGIFIFPQLAPGTYTLTVEKAGLRSWRGVMSS
jgi:hypothetical protein